MSQREFSCFSISEGAVEGEVLISTDPINFYIVDPVTGKVTEKGHALEGKSIAGKILVFSSDKGSSVVQMDGLYQMSLYKNMPKGMIVQYPSTVLVSATIVMEIPMVAKVDKEFYDQVSDGMMVKLDTRTGRISIK